MRLFLIRHAQSENNAKPDHLRIEDPGLTELGQRPTLDLANPFSGEIESVADIRQGPRAQDTGKR